MKLKIILVIRPVCLVVLTAMLSFCKGQEPENPVHNIPKESTKTVEENSPQNKKPLIYSQNTLFPQIHSNLNGMVSEFVRVMYQDSKGNFWFGTNGDGLIRYNGKILQKFTKEEGIGTAIRGIKEDKNGNIWIGSSSGLVKYDGNTFRKYATNEGLIDNEIWAIEIDKDGNIWVGSVGGLSKFNGTNFEIIEVPKAEVPEAESMLSKNRISDIMIDRKERVWLATDGYGITLFDGKSFEFITKENGLPDNNIGDIFEDSKGNIWIGTFYGGVSKYDGKSFINFTQEGKIEGIETYNFCEDHKGNIWFSAEHYGVYSYDGTSFKQFTSEDGLTTNGVQSIFTDKKGQIWFGTWKGISLYDGKIFTDVSDKETWTR